MNITPEVVEALAWLRKGWDGDNSERAITCLETLDDAGVFQAIDDFTDLAFRTAMADQNRREWGDSAYVSKVPGWSGAVEAQRKMNEARDAR